MSPLLLRALAALTATLASAAPLDSFLPPLLGNVALNADFAPVLNASAADCAARCLALGAQCISFNVCGAECGVSAFSMAYELTAADNCNLYTRIRPRNDSLVGQRVAWVAQAPPAGTVALTNTSGLLGAAFASFHDTYLMVRSPLDMLYFFYERARIAPPVGAQCFGWDEWIKGSATGNYLMGAGSYLQNAQDATLTARVQQVVDGIGALQEPNGWLWAFNESDIDADNCPDYCAGWVTRGLLDADRAGISGAYALARQQISIFNNHSHLASFLPQNGGDNPVQPFPAGFDNKTSGGYGQATGHMICEWSGVKRSITRALLLAPTTHRTRLCQCSSVSVPRRLYTLRGALGAKRIPRRRGGRR